MELEHRNEEPGNPLARSMRSTVGWESTTFGFSILVTVTFGILQARRVPWGGGV